MMTEKFTKRIMIWGLLRRVAKPDKPWVFINSCRYLFETEEKALRQATEFNIRQATPAYLYKPVEVYLEVEVDKYPLSVASQDEAREEVDAEKNKSS